jgi:hypothetical protein
VLRRSKGLILAAVAAATLASAVPASAWDGTVTAAGPCRVDVSLGIQEWYQDVVVVGEFTVAGATDVVLTCGIVRYGETVGRVGEKIPGPVGVVAGTTSVLAGPISACYEARATTITGVRYFDTCP